MFFFKKNKKIKIKLYRILTGGVSQAEDHKGESGP